MKESMESELFKFSWILKTIQFKVLFLGWILSMIIKRSLSITEAEGEMCYSYVVGLFMQDITAIRHFLLTSREVLWIHYIPYYYLPYYTASNDVHCLFSTHEVNCLISSQRNCSVHSAWSEVKNIPIFYTFWLKRRMRIGYGFRHIFHPIQNLHFVTSSEILVI